MSRLVKARSIQPQYNKKIQFPFVVLIFLCWYYEVPSQDAMLHWTDWNCTAVNSDSINLLLIKEVLSINALRTL